MTLTMLAYVKLQVYLNGEDIMKPKNRSQPAEFGSRIFGEHRYVKLSAFGGLCHQRDPNNARRLVFVGHGWGALIGFCFVTLYEKLVYRMIVINGYHPLAFVKQLRRSPKQMMMSWYTVAFRVPLLPEQYMTISDFAFFDYILWDSSTEEEVNATKYVYSRPGALTAALNYYRAFNYDSEQFMKLKYRKIRVPTLIMWGEKDRYLTTPIAEFNRKHLKTSSVVYYPEAGHWLMRQCAVSVNNHIFEFASTGKISYTKRAAESKVAGNICAESPKPSEKS
ncbi:hypothetical protein HPB50_004005 [Hyalomma asiaticum]|uniref:Uncharacterized protein n=1 Tax=Hyalomma asiaticum TaxID=266040 RepID=A0ACB7RSC2_HYAAI|nr:hypothetical protein HPB50_004005 [Hyalomma asiaticum]